MLGFLALAVGDAFACSPCGGNGERGSCADRVSAAETKRRTPAQVFFLQERMIPPIKPQLSKKEMRIPMAMSREFTPLFSPMAKRVSAFAGCAPLLPACRPPGRWPGQSMHARCREQSADAAVSYPRTTFDCRLLSIRRLRFPRFFVVQLQNFLRAD